jgi:hypothetical protein
MTQARPTLSFWFALLLVSCGVDALADTLDVAAQRQRIADARVQQIQLLQEAEKSCYGRFAVTTACVR